MDGARYLEDGKLTIFKRSGTYYARIRTSASDKYIVRSLKTTNEQTAIQAGRRLLFQIEQRAEQGLPPKSKLFAAVIDDYIRFRERDHAHGKTSAGQRRSEYVQHLSVGNTASYGVRYANGSRLPEISALVRAESYCATMSWCSPILASVQA